MDYSKEIKYFESELRKIATPERAKQEKRYLKSNLNFFGASSPQMSAIAKKWNKEHQSTDYSDIIHLVEKLWETNYHEFKSTAIVLLIMRHKDLTLKQIPLIEHMINTVNTWAHLDEIAAHLVGVLVAKDKQTYKYLEKWVKSDNFWVRRTSILAQLKLFRKGDGDLEFFEEITVPMLTEGKDWSTEERFFIRKAIGWALRELTKHNRDWVFSYVTKYKKLMSGLTFREATRKLPEKLQKELKDL